MKTYGKFRFAPPTGDRKTAVFAVMAAPYVMDRFKRIFPGCRQNTHGQLMIPATPDNARDIEMLVDRHPLEPVDAETIAQLSKLADLFRNNEAAVDRILNAGATDITFTGPRQPALTPRGYQLTVPQLLRVQGGMLLADELGTGKTFASTLICCDEGALPAAVVLPQHLVDQWVNEELPTYYPWARIHKIRKGTPYRVDQFRGKTIDPPHFLIFTYGTVQGWVEYLVNEDGCREYGIPGKIQTVIYDEADALRTGPKTANGGSLRYEACYRLSGQTRYNIGLTGTPVHNYADEMFHVADLLQRGCLGTKDEFTRTWGGKIVDNPRALGAYLRDRGIMLRRMRSDVGEELGDKPLRLEQPVETDSVKLKMMMEKGIVALASNVIAGTKEQRFTSGGQLEQTMRKATGVAKAPYVAAFVRMILETEKKVLLVGHHHEVQDIWMNELAEFLPVMYGGRQSPTQKAESKQAFVRGDSRVMVMAIKSGAGLNGLQFVCSTVVFGELDWTPPPHEQVIGRLNRDGQTAFPVVAHFMISDDGSDPVMADLLQIKRSIAHPIVDPDAELVQPSRAEQENRTRLLAEAVLKKHGIDPANMPPLLPEPEGGKLISRETLRDRMRRDQNR